MEQRNFYFDDTNHTIFNSKSMIRIRVDRALAGREKQEEREEQERVRFTFKGRGRPVDSGTTEREEAEFDLTRYFNGWSPPSEATASFRLPSFHRRFIWTRFEKEFREAGFEDASDVEIRQIANMENRRISAEVKVGLTLELDEFVTAAGQRYYELEVETLTADDKKRDEYIHLLFAALDIPIAYDQNYPQKYVITLVDAGRLQPEPEWRKAMARVEAALRKSHRESCAICR